MMGVAIGCVSSTSPTSSAAAAGGPGAGEAGVSADANGTPLQRADERHLSNIKQLTFGGENAEAYFSVDGKELILQSKRGSLQCDQIFRMNADGSNVRQVSVGGGRTTCSYIQLDGSIIYSSTHGHGPGCMWTPDHSRGYVWPVYPEMDVYRADADGKNARVLFASKGYDAESTVCSRDGRIVFTSSMDGDLELYMMDKDGQNLRRLTHTPGYDGGAFFSPDCSKIVWRASRPEGAELEEFKALLAENLVRPTKLEIFVMNADGTNVVQVTHAGKASFAPYMNADNQHIIFASNMDDPRGRNFDLYLVNADGTGLERVTSNPTFDGFPMWTHDGKKLVFASNRADEKPGETNVFIADWTW